MRSLLPRRYFPRHDENRLRSEGDLRAAREHFVYRRPPNLMYLLESRYRWMEPYLRGASESYELGAGAGFSRFYLGHGSRLTDVAPHPWIDRVVDALALPFAPGSVDALVCSHMIHHLARPASFFRAARDVLKPGGRILVSEIHTSLLMRLLLRLARHEGWSYDVDVFDDAVAANDPADPWSANCAIPELLFRDPAVFERQVPGLRVVRLEYVECFLFPLSGGVIARTATVPLPRWALRFVDALDRRLAGALPRLFALGMRVVIEKTA